MPHPAGRDLGRDRRTHLHVSIEHDHDVLRATVAGEIDLGTGDELFAALTAPLPAALPAALQASPPADGPAEMHVDLSGVRLLDAHGIGVLLAVRNRAGSCGIAFRATGAVGMVRRALEITGVDGLLGGKR